MKGIMNFLMCSFQDKKRSLCSVVKEGKKLIGLDLHWKELGRNMAHWKLAMQCEQMHQKSSDLENRSQCRHTSHNGLNHVDAKMGTYPQGVALIAPRKDSVLRSGRQQLNCTSFLYFPSNRSSDLLDCLSEPMKNDSPQCIFITVKLKRALIPYMANQTR